MFEFDTLLPLESQGPAFVAPLSFEKQVFGVLCVTYSHSLNILFSPGWRDTIKRLQQFSAVTLFNLDKLITAKHQVFRLKALQKISLHTNQVREESDLLNFINKTICDTLASQSKEPLLCEVRLREGDQLIVKGVKFTSSNTEISEQDAIDTWQTSLHNEANKGITVRAFNQQKTLYVKDIREDKHYVPTINGVQSEVAVPIMWHKQTLGVLNVEHAEVNPFTTEDIAWLKTIADQLASVLVRLRQAEQQKLFHKISTQIAQDITRELTGADLLKLIYDSIRPMSGADILQILLHDVTDNYLELQEAHPHNLKQQRIDLRSNKPIGIAGRCAKEKKAQIVGNVAGDDDYIPLYPKTNSKMVVPIFRQGRLVAVLSIHSEQFAAFLPEDQVLLETFAELAVIVRHNGQQFKNMIDLKQQAAGATALATVSAISGVYEHANRTRAVIARDRLELLESDLPSHLTPILQEHIQIIHNSLEEILESRIQVRLDDVESAQPVYASDLLKAYFQSKSQKSKYPFVCLNLADDSHAPIRVHKEWIDQLIGILTNNAHRALQNTSEPLLEITTTIDNQKGHIALRFADNGPGFPHNLLPTLSYQPIKKGKGEPGSGIGLAMARLIVSSYSGTIEAKNAPAGGAVIIIRIPYENTIGQDKN